MKRRQFIGYTGLATGAIITGGLFDSAFAGRILDNNSSAGRIPSGRKMPGMNAGRCHDHRFAFGNPTALFEKEIFGA